MQNFHDPRRLFDVINDKKPHDKYDHYCTAILDHLHPVIFLLIIFFYDKNEQSPQLLLFLHVTTKLCFI